MGDLLGKGKSEDSCNNDSGRVGKTDGERICNLMHSGASSMTHASSLAADAFAAALAAIPAEDWDRAWAADRTTCPVDRTT